MSIFTTELRYICEKAAGYEESQGYDKVEEILNTVSADGVVIPTYPIFDETYRQVLNKKILRHFYTREIGCETVGLWKLRLSAKLNEIMPYYNQLYESELLDFNPLYDVDLTTSASTNGSDATSEDGSGSVGLTKSGSVTRNGIENNGVVESIDNNETRNVDEAVLGTRQVSSSKDTTDSSEQSTNASTMSSSSSESVDKYSDTPQGGLNNFVPSSNMTYLTNARDVDDSETTSGLSNGKTATTESGTETDVSTDSNIGNRKTGTTANIDESKERTENKLKSENESNSGSSTETSSHVKNKIVTNLENYIQHVAGKRGGVSYSKMLMEFRKTFLNIDMMIIDELNILFMGLYE